MRAKTNEMRKCYRNWDLIQYICRNPWAPIEIQLTFDNRPRGSRRASRRPDCVKWLRSSVLWHSGNHLKINEIQISHESTQTFNPFIPLLNKSLPKVFSSRAFSGFMYFKRSFSFNVFSICVTICGTELVIKILRKTRLPAIRTQDILQWVLWVFRGFGVLWVTSGNRSSRYPSPPSYSKRSPFGSRLWRTGITHSVCEYQ